MKVAVLSAFVALLSCSAHANRLLKFEKDRIWADWADRGVIGRKRTSVVNQPTECKDGFASVKGEDFPCKDVDFLSYISLQDMEITDVPHMSTGIRASDIWGWESPKTGKEYTIICMDNGVAFVDTSDPINPCVLATLASPRPADTWCDIKVHKDTAYIVKDTRGGDSVQNRNIGGQVFDLFRLDAIDCPAEPLVVDDDFLWDFHGSSHNLIVNTETGFLYSVGGDTCSGGFVVIDVETDRLRPEFVSCIDGDNYTHDAQCVIYTGPDTRFTGREICFAFNEDTLTIWDVEDKQDPIMLSRMGYPGQVYCHQGWLTEDMSVVLMDDELNELCNGVAEEDKLPQCDLALGELDGEARTSTLVVDIADLTNPIYTGKYLHADEVVDHNLYLWGTVHKHGWGGNPKMEKFPNTDYAYLHNYLSGLRIMDISSHDPEKFTEIGYFDCAPDLEELTFLGAWSGYLHPSGAYAISSVERGLFMVKPNMAFDNVVTEGGTEDDEEEGENTAALIFSILIICAGAMVIIHAYAQYKTKEEEKKASENPEEEPMQEIEL